MFRTVLLPLNKYITDRQVSDNIRGEFRRNCVDGRDARMCIANHLEFHVRAYVISKLSDRRISSATAALRCSENFYSPFSASMTAKKRTVEKVESVYKSYTDNDDCPIVHKLQKKRFVHQKEIRQ